MFARQHTPDRGTSSPSPVFPKKESSSWGNRNIFNRRAGTPPESINSPRLPFSFTGSLFDAFGRSGQNGRASMPDYPAYEREADRAAGQVLGSSAPGRVSPLSRITGTALPQRAPSETSETEAAPISSRGSLGGGAPLPGPVTSRMESAFGTDFSNVRIHTDGEAERFASTMNARAVTVGSHVAFGRGAFRPGTADGDRLIAHELAHTVQQRNATAIQCSPENKDDHDPSWKERIAAWITGGAEVAYEVYEFFDAMVGEYPMALTFANLQVDAASLVAEALTDTNPQTLGWVNLGTMWLFELGPETVYFDGQARTTRDLQMEEGVQQARDLAIAEARKGNLSAVKKPWTYGQKAFYDGLKQGNLATSFLGSYSTKVSIASGLNNTVVLDFEVDNVSSWESATRLRKAAKPGGVHQGIIPNRNRGGDGLHLGGNFTQIWQWSETLKL